MLNYLTKIIRFIYVQPQNQTQAKCVQNWSMFSIKAYFQPSIETGPIQVNLVRSCLQQTYLRLWV